MFGYISPDAPYLFKKDETLYKSLYCGLCKGIVQRFFVTFFVKVPQYPLFIAVRLVVAKLKIGKGGIHAPQRHGSFVHRRNRPLFYKVQKTTRPLYFYVLALNVMNERRHKSHVVSKKKGYKKTLKKFPEIAEIIKRQTEEQAKLEKANCVVIDMAAEALGKMLWGIFQRGVSREELYCPSNRG